MATTLPDQLPGKGLVMMSTYRKFKEPVGGAPLRRLEPPFFQKGGLEGFDRKSPSVPLLKKGGGRQIL